MEAVSSSQFTPLYRVALVREREVPNPYMRGAEDVSKLLEDYLRDRDREHFVVVMLSAAGQVIGIHEAHVGDLTSCPVVGREVFKAAVILGASSIILGHNHPSGHAEPSPEDIFVTERLREAGKLLGINVLDHVIVGVGPSCSLRRRRPDLF